MSIEINLKEFRPNKALLDKKRIRKEKVLDCIETLENLLSQDVIEFTKYEIIEEKALAKAVGEYSGLSNAFHSKTEDVALRIEESVKEYNKEEIRESMRNQLNNYRRESKSLDDEIKELDRGIRAIEGGINGLPDKHKFVIECRYFRELQWKDIEIEYEKKFPATPAQEKRLQEIKAEAIELLENYIDL